MNHSRDRQREKSYHLIGSQVAENEVHGSRYFSVPIVPKFRNDHEIRADTTRTKKQYKPPVLRWPYLLALLLALFGSLAILIYAMISLPGVRSKDSSDHMGVQGLHQSSSLHQPPALRALIFTRENRAHSMDTITYKSISQTSSSLHRLPTSSYNSGAGTAAESNAPTSVLAATPNYTENPAAVHMTPLTSGYTGPESDYANIKSVTLTDIILSAFAIKAIREHEADIVKPKSDYANIQTVTLTNIVSSTLTTGPTGEHETVTATESNAPTSVLVATPSYTEDPAAVDMSSLTSTSRVTRQSDYAKIYTVTLTDIVLSAFAIEATGEHETVTTTESNASIRVSATSSSSIETPSTSTTRSEGALGPFQFNSLGEVTLTDIVLGASTIEPTGEHETVTATESNAPTSVLVATSSYTEDPATVDTTSFPIASSVPQSLFADIKTVTLTNIVLSTFTIDPTAEYETITVTELNAPTSVLVATPSYTKDPDTVTTSGSPRTFDFTRPLLNGGIGETTVDPSQYGAFGPIYFTEIIFITVPIRSTRGHANVGATASATHKHTTVTTSKDLSTPIQTKTDDPGVTESETARDRPTSSEIGIEAVTPVKTLMVATVTDAEVSSIATNTPIPSLPLSLETRTITDSEGRATPIQIVIETLAASMTVVETDSMGNPTATITSYQAISSEGATPAINDIDVSPASTEAGEPEGPAPTKADKSEGPAFTKADESEVPVLTEADDPEGSATTPAIDSGVFPWTSVETDGRGLPIATVVNYPAVPTVIVETDSAGNPTTTVTDYRVIELTSIKTDSAGNPTETIVEYSIAPSLTTQTDSAGNPTATIAIIPTVRTAVYSISGGRYFVGMFLPTLLATVLAVAARILDTSVKAFQPWHALADERGALGNDSLCLETGGLRSIVMSVRSLLTRGQAVVFLTNLLSLFATVLIPVSAGAVTLDLRGGGSCKVGGDGSGGNHCAFVLSVSPMVSKAAIGILVVMTIATILLGFMVGRWRLGVYTNPWSMCTLASLSAHPRVRQLVLDAAATGKNANLAKNLIKRQGFKLGHFPGPNGHTMYGIMTLDDPGGIELPVDGETTPATSIESLENEKLHKTKFGSHFFMLSFIGRLCMLFLLGGVLVLVLYYARTGGDTSFERFIDGDSFGVRFLFTGLGVVVSLFWSSFLDAVAIMTPYQILWERPQKAGRSILLAPPTNEFSGLWQAARTRRVFLGAVSLASIFSQFLGVFLDNVRFQLTQTFFVSQLCIWAAVGIMTFMLLILLVSFFVKWPDLPVNPTTIAGAMYYVCGTSVVNEFEMLGTSNRKERDRTVTRLVQLYELRKGVSVTGNASVGLAILNAEGHISHNKLVFE